MKNIYKVALVGTALVLMAAIGAYFYIFHSQHRNTFDAKAEFSLVADSLFKEFEANEIAANSKYLGKIIEVEGKIIGIKEMSGSYQLTFVNEMAGVICLVDSIYAVQQKDEILKLKTGDQIKIKGQCNGFLSDVQIDRCIIAIETHK